MIYIYTHRKRGRDFSSLKMEIVWTCFLVEYQGFIYLGGLPIKCQSHPLINSVQAPEYFNRGPKMLHLETSLTELAFPSLLDPFHAIIPVPASHSYWLRKPRVGLLFLGPRYSWCQAPLRAQGNLRIPSTNQDERPFARVTHGLCPPPPTPPPPPPPPPPHHTHTHLPRHSLSLSLPP